MSPLLLAIICKTIYFILITTIADATTTPRLRHRYPELNNFSYVRLECMEDKFMQKYADNPTFMRNNNTNVLNVNGMNVVTEGSGYVTLVLTQQTEGRFHCDSHGSASNTVTLAAQPDDMSSEIKYVEIDDTMDMVNLTCGIQPGAEKNKYSVTWKQFINQTTIKILDSHSFNTSVHVSNGTQFTCEVTVEHDSKSTNIYKGGRFLVINNTTDSSKDHKKLKPAAIVSVIISVVVIVLMAVVIGLLLKRKRLIKQQRNINNVQRGLRSRIQQDLTLSPDSQINLQSSQSGRVEVEEQMIEEINSPRFEFAEWHFDPVTVDFDDDDDNDNISETGRVVSSGRLSDDISFSQISSDIPGPCVSDYSRYTTPSAKALKRVSVELDTFHSTCSYYDLLPVPTTKLQSSFKSQSSIKFDSYLKPYMDKDLAVCKTSGSLSYLGDVLAESCTNPHCDCHQIRINQLLMTMPNNHVQNTSEYQPDWASTAYNLHNITYEGYTHTDKENGFIIDFPKGAVPKGMSLTVHIAICLYGPFKFPENVRCVSPIVWVCVKDFEHFQFLKPVKVSLQHCINIERTDDIESFGLQFLKAGHSRDESGLFSFQETDGVLEQEQNLNYLTLSTTHFCYFCLVSKLSPETLANTQYCLTPYQPIAGNDEIRFYVSYLLDACLSVAEKQCSSGFKALAKRKFSFKGDCLKIEFIEPENWLLGMESDQEVSKSDVNFMGCDPEVLKREEEQGLYPPRFTIRVQPLPGARHTKVHFTFRGAERKLSMDILLVPNEVQFRTPGQLPLPPTRELCSSSSATSLPGLYTPSPVTPAQGGRPIYPNTLNSTSTSIPQNAFMENVAVHARTKWRFFGIMIDIPADILDTYPGDNCLECFSKVYEYWVRRGAPPVTWEMIVSVLESDTVDEKKLADTVRKKFIIQVLPIPQRTNTSSSTGSTYTRSTHDTGYVSMDSSNNVSDMMVSDV